VPFFTQKRSRRAADRYFNDRWASADAPPWGDLKDDLVEHEKANLLVPHLDGIRSVFDGGCGGGDFLSLIAPRARFERVVGVDLAENAIERARRTGLYAQLLRAQLGEAPRHLHERFDLLMFGEVLYYMSDYREVLAELVDELLTPGGKVFIAVAMGRNYFGERDVRAMRHALTARGLARIEDTSIDDTYYGIPKRRLLVFPQSHKAVLIYGG
jgi:trans-aconitate methyltransferase